MIECYGDFSNHESSMTKQNHRNTNNFDCFLIRQMNRRDAIQEVHRCLSLHPHILREAISILPVYPECTCFRIVFEDIVGLYPFQLSIACPFMCFAYCETALIRADRLVYVDSLGYEDVKRFKTLRELVREICWILGKLREWNQTLKRWIRFWIPAWIERRNARNYIQAFILEYKDSFLYGPRSRSFQQCQRHFLETVNVQKKKKSGWNSEVKL